MSQDVTKISKGLDGRAVSFGYDGPKDDARHLVLEASKRYVEKVILFGSASISLIFPCWRLIFIQNA